MNEQLKTAIDDIEWLIINKTFNEYKSKYEDREVSIDSYYKEDDILNRPTIPKDRILEDRTKMIKVLSDFYKCNNDKEDFVTLFGIYCNTYIRYNLHQVLSEKDFGISELFESIEDNDMKKYLSLIQKGIYNQDILYFENAIEINEELKNYSLPYFYLFIDSIRKYCSFKYNQKFLDSEKKFVESLNRYIKPYIEENTDNINNYFNKINENRNIDNIDSSSFSSFFSKINTEWHDYLLGKREKNKLLNNNVDETPLPYLIVLNDEREFLDNIIKSFCRYRSRYYKKINIEKLDITDKENLYKKLKDDLKEISNEVKENQVNINDEKIKKSLLNSDFIEDRLLYLGIPSIVFQFNFFSIILKQSELYKENSDIRDKKDKVVTAFAHSYRNAQATTLYDLAKILLKKDIKEDRKIGSLILLEYLKQESLTAEVNMMKISYDNSDNELREILRNSLDDYNSDNKLGIDDVINNALMFCFINVFYNGIDKYKFIRSDLKQTIWNNNPLSFYKDDFQKNVIFEEKYALDWLLNNGFNFDFYMSKDWKLISLKPNNYAFTYLKNIFQELFLNILRHGNLNKLIKINLDSQEDRLVIFTKNYINPDELINNSYESNIRVREGLNSFAETLPKLYKNKDEISAKSCFIPNKEGDVFSLRIEIPKNVFIL